jgi:glycosyltransferase involved in cell wall biosynthesis
MSTTAPDLPISEAADAAPERMTTIAIAFPGDPLHPATWSGTPSGVALGLRAAGATVRGLQAEPRRAVNAAAMHVLSLARLHRSDRSEGLIEALRKSRRSARLSPELGRLQTRAVRGRVRALGPVDGIVQIGTGYALPDGVPFVTFEDMTVAQVLEAPYPGWSGLPRKAIRRRIDTQRRVYERADACCTTTHWVADSVVNDYGIAREKVHVVGVGRNHEPALVDRDWSVPRFLFVGIEWQRKNGDGVLRAFARLRQEIPQARLDLVGGHPPVRQDGVTGHGVLRLGVPEDKALLKDLYAAATCFVMPSHQEASALAYTEAGAAGIPSIGSTVGGSAELIGDGGLVVDPSDDDALLEAMRTLADPATAARLGDIAQVHARNFTWPAVGERLLRAIAPAGVDVARLAPFL